MKFYEIETPSGPLLVGTQVEAKKLKLPYKIVDEPTDKDGLMKRINELRQRPDGIAVTVDETTVEIIPAGADNPVEMAPSYVHQSVSLDEQFDAMPLTRKLDFAAKAMEAAREQL